MTEENKQEKSQPTQQSGVLFIITIFIVLVITAILTFWGLNIQQAKKFTAQSPTTTPASPTITITTASTSTSNYIISDSDTREITKSELQGLSEWQLKLARNEIYARHGRKFEHQDLQCYFNKQPWYKVDPNYSDSKISSIENKNIATILDYEKEIDSSYLNYDSGCSNI